MANGQYRQLNDKHRQMERFASGLVHVGFLAGTGMVGIAFIISCIEFKPVSALMHGVMLAILVGLHRMIC